MSDNYIKSLKVADLKYELTQRNLPITGSKPELQERLQKAMLSSNLAFDDGDILDEKMDHDEFIENTAHNDEDIADDTDSLLTLSEPINLIQVFKDTGIVKCLECNQQLSGTNIFILRRHFKEVHNKDISVTRTKQKGQTNNELYDRKEASLLSGELSHDDTKDIDEDILVSNTALSDDDDYDLSDDSNRNSLCDDDDNKYYKMFKELKRIVCLQCDKQLKGSTSYTIKRHYKKIHNINICTKKKKGEPAAKKREFQISTEIDKSKFLKCCVGLVMNQNFPFQMFDDKENFRCLLEPYERKFNTRMNSQNVLSLLGKSCGKIQNLIARRVRNKMISLKLDLATKMDKSILAINIQYIRDFEIYVNTLGIIQLRKGYKVTHLKEEIMKCLEIYQIDMSQIYSTTTDNGANIASINDSQEQDEEEDEIIVDDVQDLGNDRSNEKVEEDYYTMLTSILSGFKCAALNLQLAANDVLRDIKTELNECRNAIKELRKLIRAGDKEISFEMPKLDNKTRWNTSYEMMQCLLQIRQQMEDIKVENNTFPTINWDFVNAFVVAFRPLSVFAKQLQSQQYIIGDFYRDWLCCEIELEDLFETSPYATPLYQAMQNRKKMLLDNNSILGALYVDPRFNNENSLALSEDQKAAAIAHLVKTFETLTKLSNENSHQQNELADPLNTSENTSFRFPSSSQSTYSKLDQRLMESISTSASAEIKRSFRQKLMFLSNQCKVPFETDVLQYWRKINVDSDVKKVAAVALTVPATQISVEKAFIALSNIITRRRQSLKFDNASINNLILTKLNLQELNSKKINLAE